MYLKNVKIMYCVTGTGKTRALIGAISEIVHTTGKCVLVFANSIAACDEITEHLIIVHTTGEIVRLYTRNHSFSLGIHQEHTHSTYSPNTLY